MARVPLTRGYEAQVDDADAPSVLAHRWSARVAASGKVYAKRNIPHPDPSRVRGRSRGGRAQTEQGLGTFLLGKREGFLVDHIDGNTLDYRRSNLRHVRPGQNSMNVGKHRRGQHRFKGLLKRQDGWHAQLVADGQRHRRGPFPTDLLAAKAYDALALEHHGVYARPNFPRGAKT